jgi:hypothetical protein
MTRSHSPDVPADWVVQATACGHSLHLPVPWRVLSDGQGGLAVMEPQGQAAALVRARRVQARASLAAWLEHDYPATEAGLHQVRMLDVRAIAPRVACASFDYGGHLFRGRASAVAVRRGQTATVYVAAAALEQIPDRLADLARILASVRVRGGRDLPAAGIDLTRLLRLGIGPPPTATPSRMPPAHPVQRKSP